MQRSCCGAFCAYPKIIRQLCQEELGVEEHRVARLEEVFGANPSVSQFQDSAEE